MLNRTPLLPGSTLTLTNARVVLANETITGTVHVVDGLIDDVSTGVTSTKGAEDIDDGYIMPGIVELHTDHLEGQLRPRPGVMWPAMAALTAHDAQIAASGITTVFDAMCCGFTVTDKTRSEILPIAVKAIREGNRLGHLRADHHLHLRCEVSDPKVMDMLLPLMETETVDLISIMDHTPGQRQFASLEMYKKFYIGRHGLTEAEVDANIATYQHGHNTFAHANRKTIVDMAKARNIPLATHDDETEAHIIEATGFGIDMSEFPTTMVAAAAAKSQGMSTIGGAPNAVRGGSHSGNVSVMDLAEAGTLDALSSDYVPMSLIQSVPILRDKLGCDLSAAVAFVSANPARMVGLADRGSIEVGKRADLIHVTDVDNFFHVRQVWRQGMRVV